MDNSKSKLKFTLVGDGAEAMFSKLIAKHFLPDDPVSIVFDTSTPTVEIMAAIMLFHNSTKSITILIGKSKIENDKPHLVYTIKTIDTYRDILAASHNIRTVVCSEIIKEEDLFLAAPDIRVGIGLNPEYCSPLQVALHKRFTALLPDVKYPSHYYAIIASSSEGDIMLARLIL